MLRKFLVTMGMITFDARRQIVQSRLAPASAAIIVGAIPLILWKLLRKQKAQAK
jgi:hypothetical protein